MLRTYASTRCAAALMLRSWIVVMPWSIRRSRQSDRVAYSDACEAFDVDCGRNAI